MTAIMKRVGILKLLFILLTDYLIESCLWRYSLMFAEHGMRVGDEYQAVVPDIISGKCLRYCSLNAVNFNRTFEATGRRL